jgi:hypothetical protein
MAVITIGLTAALCIAYLKYLTHSDRRYYWLLLVGLPFSFIINRWVKVPVITALGAWAGIPLKLAPEMPYWFIALRLIGNPSCGVRRSGKRVRHGECQLSHLFTLMARRPLNNYYQRGIYATLDSGIYRQH